MNSLLTQINETLQQLNEVDDLRNANANNKLKTLIDLLNSEQWRTNLGIKLSNADELFKNSDNPEWNKVYQSAVGGHLITNGDTLETQYVTKLNNAFAGKADMEANRPSEGYIKFSVDSLSRLDREDRKVFKKWKETFRHWAKSLNTPFTTSDFTLVPNKQDASVFNRDDLKEVQGLFKRLIRRKPVDSNADTAWFFTDKTHLSSEVLYSSEGARENGRIPASFIMQLYFYLFAGDEPHASIPTDMTKADEEIVNYYNESLKANEDKVKTWTGLVNKSSNLTANKYDAVKGDKATNDKLLETIKTLEVGGKTVADIWGDDLNNFLSTIHKLKLAWKIDDSKFNQNYIDKSFLLAAYLGGLCKNLDNNNVYNLPKLYANLQNEFASLKPQYKDRFANKADFAQSILLDTTPRGEESNEFATQDWDVYLEREEELAAEGKSMPKEQYKRVSSNDPSFLTFNIRSTDEMKPLLNNVFKDDDEESASDNGSLNFMIKKSSSSEITTIKLRAKSSDSSTILIPVEKSLPANAKAFEFKPGDEIQVCYASDGKTASWNEGNILKTSAIKGTLGSKIKKSDTTGQPSIQEDLKFDLSKLEVTIELNDTTSLAKASIIDISSGTGVTGTTGDDVDDTTSDDGSENLSDDKIKEAMVNWLWSKKPKTLKTVGQVGTFVKKEQPFPWESKKEAVIDEVKAKPDYYTYNADLKTFDEVKEDSELQKLLDDLNNDSNGTVHVTPPDGNNIPGVNISNQERSKPIKMNASDVRTILTNLAAALADTKDDADLNKVSDQTRAKLKSSINSAADLADIVLWLNKMAGIKKSKK